ESSLAGLQHAVGAGELDRVRYGGDYLTSAESHELPSFVNYVKDVTRLSRPAHDAFHHPLLLDLIRRCFSGAEPWEFDETHADEFSVIYQDARPGPESWYTRIGW